jgi:hypothetical protein
LKGEPVAESRPLLEPPGASRRPRPACSARLCTFLYI